MSRSHAAPLLCPRMQNCIIERATRIHTDIAIRIVESLFPDHKVAHRAGEGAAESEWGVRRVP